jgi:hypothetical protein
MTRILVGHKEDLKIHYHAFIVLSWDQEHLEHSVAIRKSVRELLSLLAKQEESLPADLSEVVFYSTHLDQHISLNPQEFVKDFIKFKRTKFKYDYTAYRPYTPPTENEFIPYFLRALQSLKTRLESNITKAVHRRVRDNGKWTEDRLR